MHFLRKLDILVLFLSVVCATLLNGQQDELRISNYGFEDGLSHRNVYKVAQDHNGFIWVATAKGLNRFDGHKFLSWAKDKNQDVLPTDIIHDLIVDDQNRIWMANGASISIFDPAENILDSVKHNGRKQEPNNLCIDGTGKLWATAYVPSDTSVWLQRTDDTGQLRDVIKLPGKYKNRPAVRQGGLIYVGAYENELWVFDLDGKQIKQYEFPTSGDRKQLPRVIQLIATEDGTIWAQLNHGQLYYLPLNGSSFLSHPLNDFIPEHLNASSFLITESGDIWVGGIVTGQSTSIGEPCNSTQPGPYMLHYNATSDVAEDHSYFLKQVLPYGEPPRQIFQDRMGVIWIATPFGLVHLVENNLFTSYMADGNDCCRDGVCSMRGMTEDEKGNIYLSYYSSIHVLNPKTGSLLPLFSKQIGMPYGILYSDNALWTGDGLRINLTNYQVDTIFPALQGAEGVLMKDQRGIIWFGSKHHLKNYNPRNGSINDFSANNEFLQQKDIKQVTYLHPGATNDYFWMGYPGKRILQNPEKWFGRQSLLHG